MTVNNQLLDKQNKIKKIVSELTSVDNISIKDAINSGNHAELNAKSLELIKIVQNELTLEEYTTIMADIYATYNINPDASFEDSASGAEVAEETTKTYNLVLVKISATVKLAAIQAIKKLTGLNLSDSKKGYEDCVNSGTKLVLLNKIVKDDPRIADAKTEFEKISGELELVVAD